MNNNYIEAVMVSSISKLIVVFLTKISKLLLKALKFTLSNVFCKVKVQVEDSVPITKRIVNPAHQSWKNPWLSRKPEYVDKVVYDKISRIKDMRIEIILYIICKYKFRNHTDREFDFTSAEILSAKDKLMKYLNN